MNSLKYLRVGVVFFFLGGLLATQAEDGLLLHYTFDSNEGSIVTDQTTNGWDATVSSTLWISNGVHGGGVEFDSSATSHLYLNSAEVLNDREAFTISTWFRANDPSVNQTIMMVGGGDVQMNEHRILGLAPSLGSWMGVILMRGLWAAQALAATLRMRLGPATALWIQCGIISV